MKRFTFLALVLGACGPQGYYDNQWGFSDVTAHGDDEFVGRVSIAVDAWNRALYDSCGMPVFTLVESGGKGIHELSREEWVSAGNPTGYIGLQGQYRIDILDNDEELATIVHELGHAVGLPHVTDFESDPDTCMWPTIIGGRYVPSALDAEHAATALGCM